MSRKLDDKTNHSVYQEHLVVCENYFYLSKRTRIVSTCLEQMVCNTAMFLVRLFSACHFKIAFFKNITAFKKIIYFICFRNQQSWSQMLNPTICNSLLKIELIFFTRNKKWFMSRELDDKTNHSVNLECFVGSENYFYVMKRSILVSTGIKQMICNTAMFFVVLLFGLSF